MKYWLDKKEILEKNASCESLHPLKTNTKPFSSSKLEDDARHSPDSQRLAVGLPKTG